MIMKIILSIILLSICNTAFPQNVGIGTTTPAEKLDVNGNLNLQGQLKINGNAGNAGQVLAKDGANNLSWLDLSNYPNFSTYDCNAIAAVAGTGNCGSSWTVPAGVTTILVEAWGGGGGGCSMSGGGGGAYAAARIAVTPSSVVSITVGAGGNYGSGATPGIAGGNTLVTAGAVTLTAFGGTGGNTGDPHALTLASPSLGGNFLVTGTSQNQYTGLFGSHGLATKIEFKQVSATDFARFIYFGDGGDAGNTQGTGAKGGFQIYSTISGVMYSTTAQSIPATPGAGGGADHTFGFTGRGGRVIIHW